MRYVLAIVVSLTCLYSPCRAEEQALRSEQKAKDSYSLGYDFGANLKSQGIEVDLGVLISAIKDGMENRKPALTPEEMKANLMEMRRRLSVRQDRHARQFAAKNLEDGKNFLEANKSQEGVQALPSGLQYRVLTEGTGTSPKPSDSVTVHYRGTLIDGKEFDNSYSRGEPATLPLGGVIAGWQEALPLMKTGSKWQIFVPADLAYGRRQSARIPPNSTLVFELELLGISESTDLAPERSALDTTFPPTGTTR